MISFDREGLHLWPGDPAEGVRALPVRFPAQVVEVHFLGQSGRLLVNLWSPDALILDLDEAKVISRLGHPRNANLGAASPDGRRVLTSSSGGLVTLWDAATGQRVGAPMRFGDFSSAVLFSPDGSRYLASSSDGTVRVWATGPREPAARPYRFDCGRANLLSVRAEGGATTRTYSPDGRRWADLTGGENAALLAGRDLTPRRLEHPGPVESACFCDDGSAVVLAGAGAIRAWDPGAITPLGPIVAAEAGPKVPLRRAIQKGMRPDHLSRDGRRIVCWDDEKTLSVWDLAGGRRVFGPARHPAPGPTVFGVSSAAIDGAASEAILSPDGRRLAVGIESSGTLSLWDVESGAVVFHKKLFRGFIRKIGFSRDGSRVFVITSDGMHRIYDAGTGEPLGPTIRQPDATLAADVSPDGSRGASYNSLARGLPVVDLNRGERLLTIPSEGSKEPTSLWFDAAGGSLNLDRDGTLLTIPLPRFEVPFPDSAALVRFLAGQRIDDAEGVEFVDQFTFSKEPGRYRDMFRAWKGLRVDGK